ncbi:enoyl-CoA hydratase/isomerase family protein [Patulibacter sp.]|uniref:enoyl-CoA hydratase/isomerase family protein n=1 Tax=Patulibacter sp. TaxID=1912859 RepID=UPI002717D98E|nr:enoyl-CoA hydratase-related protein [Patulibacter sp.]MDO9407626.1 enoyl-CoA hydratase-related protein [Patulibacter sp.]
MPGELLIDHPADGVVRLTISNPERHGALDHAVLDAIAAAVGEHGGEAGVAAGVRAIVLTGAGGRFSSGYDLGGLGDLPREEFVRRAEALIAHPFTAAIEALEATDVPTVAALPGHTMGGGLELALACDLRVAADHIELAMPPAKLGLVYPHTGLRRFVDVIGVARTRELFLLGHAIDPGTALAWGLINGTADAEDLQDEVLALATDLAGHAPLAQRGNKRMLRELLGAEGEVTPELQAELVALREASFRSDDLLEGVTAFREKRAPVWRGR